MRSRTFHRRQIRHWYRIGKRIDGRTALQFGDIDVVLDTSGGTPVDRSFEERLLEQGFAVNLRKKQELKILLQYREREFTTPFAADLGRFGREDTRVRVDVSYGKRLTKKLSVRAQVGLTENDSDRIDPTVPTDEVGYEEITAGVGLGYKF